MGGVSPRFRQDLIAVAADAEGVAYVDVQDPRTGTQFRFYDFEYALATQMDGRPIDEIVAWGASTYGMELTEEGIGEFSRQLGDLGFLETAAPQAGAPQAGAPQANEDEDEQHSVSHLVNEAVSQVGASSAHHDSGAAYGDFSVHGDRGGDGGGVDGGGVNEETTADAEWSAEGARTVSAGPLAEMLAAEVPMMAQPHETAAAGERESEAAASEFSESEQTSHWVPPFAPDHQREPSHWAESLNDNLQGAGNGGSAANTPSPAAQPPPASETLLGFGAAASGLGAMSPASATPAPFGKGSPRRSSAMTDVTPPPRSQVPGSMPEPFPKRPPPSDPAMMMTPPPVTPPVMSAVTPPPMVPFERRQPPAPEEVVMSAFQQGAAAATAADQSVAAGGAAPRVPQFRAPLEAPPRSSRGPKIAALIMLVLLAAAGIAYYLWTTSVAAAAVRHVRVLSPKPTAVYRWFDSTGRVTGGESRTLAFEGGGRVTDLLPAGSAFSAGEIIARLQGAALVETDVSRHRARLLFYEQMRDSMRAANNAPELRQAEIKIGIKTGLLTEAEALLAPRVIRPAEAGQVIEVLVKAGDTVQPHMAALKINPGRLRGEFLLTEADWPAAQALAFCRVEVVGQAPTASITATARRGETPSAADSGPPQAAGSARYLDCQPRPEGAGAGQAVVELPSGASVTVGQPLRLARARFDGVFPVPRSAVAHANDTDRVFVATVGGIAEARAVTLADRAGDEVLVAQGLDVGDAVIIEGPTDLHDGSHIVADR